MGLTDEKNLNTVGYLLRKKSRAFLDYQKHEAWLKNQYDIIIKTLQVDREEEFISKDMRDHLPLAVTLNRLTSHDDSAYNRLTERVHRTIFEKVRALLLEARAPRSLWGEAA